MNRVQTFVGALLCAALVLGVAGAAPRSVSVNGVELRPVIETKMLPSGREGLPVWFLPRLGVQTHNDADEVRLSYAGRTLRFALNAPGPSQWTGIGAAGRLSAPERYGPAGSVHVSLEVLRALGVPLNAVNSDAHRLDIMVGVPATHVLAAPRPPAVTQAPLVTPKGTLPKTAPKVAPKTATQSAAAPASKAAHKPAAFGVLAFAPPAAAEPPTGLRAGSAAVMSSPVTVMPAGTTSAAPPPSAPASSVPVSSAAPLPPPSAVSPEVPLIGPRVLGIRSSLDTVRSVQVQRIVVDLTGPVTYTQRPAAQGEPLNLFLLGATAGVSSQSLDSGDTLSFEAATQSVGGSAPRPGLLLHLKTRGAVQRVQTLQNPDRLVIDTATLVGDAPPPINPDTLPAGVTLRQTGALSLLSFDPARFVPRVVAAPVGSALSVAELVRRAGGVAGVNGGYFDPPSSLGVDFVGVRGQMLSASLEKRAAVGFDAQGHVQFGYPRPRYFVSVAGGQPLMVNAVTARPAAGLLSAFVGDGRTAAGAPGLTTLVLAPVGAAGTGSMGAGSDYQVQRVQQGSVTVPAGLLSLSFDPARFAQLPRTVGAQLNVRLDYQLQSWSDVRDGLAAGPLLLQGGRMVLDPVREGFNIYTGIWRPTRQVAFALYGQKPTIAFMDFGTPETFAAALQKAGVTDAMRLDSGSSATVYVTGGYLGTGGYLNTVWSRPVPNAIVLVPR